MFQVLWHIVVIKHRQDSVAAVSTASKAVIIIACKYSVKIEVREKSYGRFS